MAKPILTDGVDKALKAIEQIKLDAGRLDKRVEDAERRAAEAEARADRDRLAKGEAESKVDGLEREVIEARASVAAQVATLEAEKAVMAERDRASREELERLKLAERQSKGQRIKQFGVTTLQ